MEHFDSELHDLVRLMQKELRESGNGLAVAAPQIGVTKQVVVYRLTTGDEGVLVNPRIRPLKGRWMYQEGCLSFPGMFWWVDRPNIVELTYFDKAGNEHRRTDDTIYGRLWQHEVDHLHGRLVIDLLNKTDRRKVERKMTVSV